MKQRGESLTSASDGVPVNHSRFAVNACLHVLGGPNFKRETASPFYRRSQNMSITRVREIEPLDQVLESTNQAIFGVEVH
jgi:hypothetical protein